MPEEKPSGAYALGPERDFDVPLTQCPLCGTPELAALARDYRDISIDRCRACHHRFMNPQYTSRALESYYASYVAKDSVLADRKDPLRRVQKSKSFRMLRRYLSGGRVLSIGCGDGLELSVAREQGFEVEGYDVDSESTRVVSEKTGLTVRSGDLFRLPYEPDSFDCVFMDHVLEHPKNPAEHLRFVHRVLKPGGLCYIGVPNIGSVSNRWKSLRDRWGVRSPQRRGSHYDTWHHLHYYTPASLTRVLPRLYGLEIVALCGDPYAGSGGRWKWLRRRFPILESSMVVLAKKCTSPP